MRRSSKKKRKKRKRKKKKEIELVPEPVSPVAEIQVPKIPKGHYKEDPNAKLSKESITFQVEGFTFTIRVPDTVQTNDPVRVDWLNERFTKSEAELLNGLQLSTYILNKAYGVGYKWHVANFMASIALSSCFKESTLLLNSECSDARRFLRKIAFEVQRECLNRATKEWGTPSKGFVQTVEETKTEEEEEEEEQPNNRPNNELESESTFLLPEENENENIVPRNSRALPKPSTEDTRGAVSFASAPSRGIVTGLQNLRLGDEYPELSSLSQNLRSLQLGEMSPVLSAVSRNLRGLSIE